MRPMYLYIYIFIEFTHIFQGYFTASRDCHGEVILKNIIVEQIDFTHIIQGYFAGTTAGQSRESKNRCYHDQTKQSTSNPWADFVGYTQLCIGYSERHSFSNHTKLDSLFNSLFRLTTLTKGQ